MAGFPGEFGSKEGPGQVLGEGGSDDSRAQAEDVDVVVFDHLMSRVGVVGDAGSDSPDLVGGNTRPGPGSTNEHSSRGFSIKNSSGSGQRGVRVINGFGVMGAEVEDGMALIGQEFGQMLLEFESGMVSGDSDSHVA